MSLISDLIREYSGQYQTVSFKRPYVDFTGSIEGALLLDQMIYWSDKGDDDGWFYKTYLDWEREIYVKERAVRQLARDFQVQGFLEIGKRRTANGIPKMHYRFSVEAFAIVFEQFLKSRYSQESRFDIFAGTIQQKRRIGKNHSKPAFGNDSAKVPNQKRQNCRIETAELPDRNGRIAGLETAELPEHPYIQLTTCNELQTTPERVREEPDFCGEVISCEIVSDSEPESDPSQNRSLSIEVKPKDSPLCLEILHADDLPQSVPKIKAPVLAPQRLDNALDRQLSRKGIDPADYTRFRGKYAPYANAVTVHGFGSDEYTHRAWLDLVKDGWKPDADFWRGLDLEVAWGLEIYKKTKEPLPGVPGGPAFLRSRRWIQAIDRDEVRSKLGSVGLDMHVEKSRDLVKEESFARMRAAIEAVRKKIELEQLNQQELEECHDF